MAHAQTIGIATDAPPVILRPDPAREFAARARRFRALARKHALGGWLDYLGRLAEAQHGLLQALPLDADARPAWREWMRSIAVELSAASPEPMRERLTALSTKSPGELEAMASALLDGRPAPAALPEHMIVGACLQVAWTARAARFDPDREARDDMGVCPCCGSPPVASVVRASVGVNNLRYLHCSLCNTEWNLPRALCSVCAQDRAVAYRHVEQCGDAVRAECCDHCQSYLKLMIQEKAPDIDPVADDLASVALDVLLAEEGYARSGTNFFLLCGSGSDVAE